MSEAGRPSYELDAPAIVVAALGTLAGGAALLVFALAEAAAGNLHVPGWSWELGLGLLGAGTIGAGFLFHAASGRRFRERDSLAASVDLDGTPRLLDVGCGSGIVLFELLRRAPHATGVGVEAAPALSSRDDLGDRFHSNARDEGVAERAELVTSDLRELPFRDASFDIVVSRGILASLRTSDSLREALVEMTRVVRPGGQIVLVVTDASRMPGYGEVLDGGGFDSEIRATPGLFSTPLVLSRKAAADPATPGP